MVTSDQKGAIAEIEIQAAAVRLGVPVFRPVAEHGRADLVLEIAGKLFRVQVKYATQRGGVIRANLECTYYSPRGYIRSTYSADEVDLIAVYCSEVDQAFLLPIAQVAGRREIFLRTAPTKNGQRASLNWASHYEFDGAIAQLEERLNGIQEVVGSSPTSSTSAPPPAQIGSQEFQKHYGYWAEQVVNGRKVVVTKRGRPYLRLAAAQPKLVAA